MTIAFFSGAYKNAGDFLIEHRSIELIKYVYPKAVIKKFLRNEIPQHLKEINSCDVGIFGGGPLALRNLDGYLKLDCCLHEINIPLMLLGIGWYGYNGSSHSSFHYTYSEKTLQFFNKIDREGFGISCRDINTYNTIRKEGLKNIFVTGCPAWYCINHIFNTDFHGDDSVNKIMISDPAKGFSFNNAKKVSSYLRNRYPNANITMVFHKGINTKSQKDIADFVKKENIDILEISSSVDGFKFYNPCDLHIGFRVHAHLYNLSIRNRSILIEEDGRGSGANEILGLPSLKSYSDIIQVDNKVYQKLMRDRRFYQNAYLIDELDTYLCSLKACQGQYWKNAFELQKHYFDSMINFIKRIG